jgi:protein SCO1/2
MSWRILTLLLGTLCLELFAAPPVPPCCRAEMPAGTPTDTSLYLLDSTWTSDIGKAVKLSVFRGRPQIVALFFAQCEYACPIIVSELKAIEEKLPPEILGKVDFLLVSIDPRRDTPAALAEFRRKRALPTERWSLLCGAEDNVRELAALLGVNYAEDSRGQFAHTNLITLLNAEGEIAFQHTGLRQDPALLIAAIGRAAAASKR